MLTARSTELPEVLVIEPRLFSDERPLLAVAGESIFHGRPVLRVEFFAFTHGFPVLESRPS